MNWLRIALVAAAALGVTWAAEQATQQLAGLQAQAVVVAQAADGETAQSAAGAESDDSGDGIRDLSAEEIERELDRIEAAVAGEELDELEEFTPTEPLPADLAIPLPSDI